jgi:hypothetical protein
MISSLNIILYYIKSQLKFWEELECAFGVLLERSWWAGLKGILFDNIWSQNVRDIEFLSDFCCWNFQINSKKPGFGSKNQLGMLIIQLKHDFLSYLAVQNINTYIAKQCSHVELPYFVMGSHLGQRHRPHYLTWKIEEDKVTDYLNSITHHLGLKSDFTLFDFGFF